MPLVTVRNRFSRVGLQSRAPRRKTSWAVGPSGIVSLTASSVAIFPNGAQVLFDGDTEVRLRGELILGLALATSAFDGFSGAVGICYVSENAFNAGVASIPTPITDIAWDGWTWFQMFHLKNMSAGLDEDALLAQVRIVVDSKAMRKLRATDIQVAVIEATEVGASQLHAEISTRSLLKLP